MCRHCARLSLIVSHRMVFVDQYSHRTSGCSGVARCLHMAWVWPASGKSRGRSEDAAEASNDGGLPHAAVTDTPPATQLNPVFRVTWRSCASTQSLQTPEVLPIGCTPRVARSGRSPDAIGPPPRPEDQVRFSTKSPSPANWPGKVQTGSPPPPSVCSRIFRAHPYAPEPSSIPHHARITIWDAPTNARRTQIPQIPFPARPSPTCLRSKNAG